MSIEREMTEDELIDAQAEACFNLGKQIHEVIVGKDSTIITVVLARTLAIVSRHANLSRDVVLAQVQFVVNEVYGLEEPKEGEQ